MSGLWLSGLWLLGCWLLGCWLSGLWLPGPWVSGRPHGSGGGSRGLPVAQLHLVVRLLS